VVIAAHGLSSGLTHSFNHAFVFSAAEEVMLIFI
jgi:hypothetical protein